MMIQGRVAMILSEYQLVISVGEEHGVNRGDAFVIYEEGDQVVDPSTGDVLGRIELVKATVQAVHVQEKLCLVESPRKARIETVPDVLSARLAEVTPSAEEQLVREHEKLDVLRAEISAGPAMRPIRVGDRARKV